MTDSPHDRRSWFSRREWLRRAGLAGAAAAVVPIDALVRAGAPRVAAGAGPQADALETLTAAEGVTLTAIVGRLIPRDENGPGAADAGAARYIDRALGDALASSREAYRVGLAAVDRHAQRSKGAPLAQLSAPEQDAVLAEIETGVATGFAPSSSAFFSMVRAHTIQGTFCDPYYGGNANFIGWDLLGYPGVRLAVGSDDQRLDARLTPTHASAYDSGMFSKPPRAIGKGERPDGD